MAYDSPPVDDRPRTALVVVDVQNDFCEGGSLAVTGGAVVAERIADHVRAQRDRYVAVVATRDRHVDPGAHFAEEPDYVETWPPHCVVGTPGAELHPALRAVAFDAVVDKGAHAAAYSGFEGVTADGQPLASWLTSAGVRDIVVCGIATDHCVRATALDAVEAGFGTAVRHDLCAAVAPETEAAALRTLEAAGVRILPG